MVTYARTGLVFLPLFMNDQSYLHSQFLHKQWKTTCQHEKQQVNLFVLIVPCKVLSIDMNTGWCQFEIELGSFFLL